jgi:hypothetical protein
LFGSFLPSNEGRRPEGVLYRVVEGEDEHPTVESSESVVNWKHALYKFRKKEKEKEKRKGGKVGNSGNSGNSGTHVGW